MALLQQLLICQLQHAIPAGPAGSAEHASGQLSSLLLEENIADTSGL
jgi:hypothetical protein